MSMLTLGNLIDFNELELKYNKRVKLRFNTDWKSKETRVGHCFRMMYFDDERLLNNWMNSTYSEKTTRQNNNEIVMQFIEILPHRWLFVDAVNVIKKEGSRFTDTLEPKIYYDMWTTKVEPVSELDKFKGILVVDWRNKNQAWRYTNRNIIDVIPVYEILHESYKTLQLEFPGFDNISLSYNKLKRVIHHKGWQQALSSVYGVYVITDTVTGKQYVGSAYGDQGVYGRWVTYLTAGFDEHELENNHYPNKKLKDIVDDKGIQYIQNNFQYSLLEIFSKNESGKTKALEREIYWKNVLRTREFGYNAN